MQLQPFVHCQSTIANGIFEMFCEKMLKKWPIIKNYAQLTAFAQQNGLITFQMQAHQTFNCSLEFNLITEIKKINEKNHHRCTILFYFFSFLHNETGAVLL